MCTVQWNNASFLVITLVYFIQDNVLYSCNFIDVLLLGLMFYLDILFYKNKGLIILSVLFVLIKIIAV